VFFSYFLGVYMCIRLDAKLPARLRNFVSQLKRSKRPRKNKLGLLGCGWTTEGAIVLYNELWTQKCFCCVEDIDGVIDVATLNQAYEERDLRSGQKNQCIYHLTASRAIFCKHPL